MNKAKLVMSALTLTGTIVMAVFTIGAKNLLAARSAPADSTVKPANAAQRMLEAQSQAEHNLAEMQAQEGTYAEQIQQANEEIQRLNEELTQLQLEGQNNQAAITEAQNMLAYAQNRAAQLRGLIATIPEREGQWQAAIQQANQNITELQAYIAQYNQQAAASSGDTNGDDDEDHEGEGDEHEDEDD